MTRLTLIAALGAVTMLPACMEDTVDAQPTRPVVVPGPTQPVVTGQSGTSLSDTVAGKGPVVVDAGGDLVN